MARRFSVEAVFKAVDQITRPVSRMQGRVGRFTRSFEMGLRRVDRVARRVNATVGRHLRRGVIAVGAAIGATAHQMGQLADQGDELAKRTRRLDFPIEEFQQWQFVAEQAGVETGQFDKALDVMTKRLGEAGNGQGRLSSMLQRTNPALLEQLTSAENSAEAFDILMREIQSIENPMERAALTTAAFSNAGAEMSQIARMGADDIERLRREQVRNGVITQEQAEAMERYNDATGSLRRTITGLRLAVLAPLFEDMTEGIRLTQAWLLENRELIASRIGAFFEFIRDNFAEIVTWLRRIGIALAVWWSFMAVLKAFIVVMTAVNIVMAMNPIGLLVIGITAAIVAFGALIWWVQNLVREARVLDPLFEGFAAAGRGIMAGWNEVKSFFSDLTSAITGDFEGLKDRVSKIIDFITRGVDRARDLVSRLPFVGGDDGSAGADGGTAGAGPSPQVVGPSTRVSRSIEEQLFRQTSEVTIRDETGRAEITRAPIGPSGLQLTPTGAY